MTDYVAVVGSRNYPDEGQVRAYVREQVARGRGIVTGGAPGVDTWAEDEVRRQGFDSRLEVIRPDYKRYGRHRAPKVRNWLIVRKGIATAAFWAGESPGTAHAVTATVAFGKYVRVFTPGDGIGRDLAEDIHDFVRRAEAGHGAEGATSMTREELGTVAEKMWPGVTA